MGEFSRYEPRVILFTNNMKTVTLVWVCVLQLTMAFDIDLKELLTKAKSEIKAASQFQMMAGARSSHISLKKSTAV